MNTTIPVEGCPTHKVEAMLYLKNIVIELEAERDTIIEEQKRWRKIRNNDAANLLDKPLEVILKKIVILKHSIVMWSEKEI